MASRTIPSKPARQLGELLEEQQEPFILEVYLSEKGCGAKNLTPIHGGSTKNKTKKGIPKHIPKVLKLIPCNKFFTSKGLRRTNNPNDEDGKTDTFSCSALCNSSSDSEIDEEEASSSSMSSKMAEKAVVDTNMEDTKQHSPQSVLEAMSTSTGSNTMQKSFILPKLITEESILSATLWNLLLQTTDSEQSSGSSSFSMSKRVLQQTKQLLLDCVRELVDHNNGCMKEGKGKRYLGSEEIGNVICEKIKGWGKQRGDETNIQEMLELDVIETKQEWEGFEIESYKKEMGICIGNAIVEELISDVVMDMIDGLTLLDNIT
ncbi:hypothetical protein ES332_D06G030500v1 [Gossypium tomentosum]|uniref:DUF4378 domain-containing protein n=1 Tax=Gossypium tomentosum TaxID=34277 RepID=A0A5D2KDD0_GOSTO|nr:hypothetical protein ES332_D06G030500v1 [Gossypium tomentosum]